MQVKLWGEMAVTVVCCSRCSGRSQCSVAQLPVPNNSVSLVSTFLRVEHFTVFDVY